MGKVGESLRQEFGFGFDEGLVDGGALLVATVVPREFLDGRGGGENGLVEIFDDFGRGSAVAGFALGFVLTGSLGL